MARRYLLIPLLLEFLLTEYTANGLKCYNCHAACPRPGENPINCELAHIYLDTISYNRSRDGEECPEKSDFEGWTNPKYTEECKENSVCGKREISLHVKFSSENVVSTENPVTHYPILQPNRIYHTVIGCMRPMIDCNRKTFDKVIRTTSTNQNNETMVISGRIVEEADCKKCSQDLCNAGYEHSEEQSDSNEHATSEACIQKHLPALVVGIIVQIFVLRFPFY